MEKTCPYCGTISDSKFCPECGANLAEVDEERICPKCGLTTRTKFCPKCGTNLYGNSSSFSNVASGFENVTAGLGNMASGLGNVASNFGNKMAGMASEKTGRMSGSGCAICGTKLIFVNQCEYTIADGEKICLDCRDRIFKACNLQEPDQHIKDFSSAIQNQSVKNIAEFGLRIKSGSSVKDAFLGKNTQVSDIFKSKTAEEWRELLGIR